MKHETLTAALAEFQKTLPHIAKGKEAAAGKYSYAYADLTDVTAKVVPLLAAQGLAWSAQPTMSEHGFVLLYELSHESGERIGGTYPLPAASTPPQQLGSAITYARRYALTAVTGVAPGGDDYDAQAAQQHAQQAWDWDREAAGPMSRGDVDAMRALWQEARAGGAPQDFLDSLRLAAEQARAESEDAA